MRRTGFTLIEVLIVIAVLAILAALVVPRLLAAGREAREGSLKAHLAEMRAMIDAYKQQHDAYPTSLEVLTKEQNKSTGKPYLSQIPPDPFTGSADYNYDSKTGAVHSKAEDAHDGTAYKDY
ncbi:MAG: type II secretion system protein [Candidatus Berkelbacteria bacterium]|nr:type II secretion system protein [Candidatus Berkelbacteria bacterium]